LGEGIIIINSRKECISDAFFVLGSQYYAVARHSAEEFVSPLAGTLYHHAIEMLLKGALSRQMSITELRDLGHNLVNLWRAYKSEYPQSNLAQHDLVIEKINRFEKIRYPDSIVNDGMRVGIKIGGQGPALVNQIPGNAPKYEVNTERIDNVIRAIFESSNTRSDIYLGQIPEVYRKLFPETLLLESKMTTDTE